MSADSFTTRHRAKHGHRYREDADNAYEAPQPTPTQVSHGDWGSRESWAAPAGDWNSGANAWNSGADSWNAAESWGEPADRQPQPTWQAAQSEWNAQPRWENAAAWDEQSAWNSGAADQSAWDEPHSDWQGAPADTWNAPDAGEWAPQRQSAWDDADPAPSGEHRPVYSFRTASGARLEFSGDGARVDQQEPEDDSAAARPTRSGGRRRAAGAHRLPAPPAALKGRAAVVAVAAGAVVAAGQAGMDSVSSPAVETVDYQAAAQVREISSNETLDGGLVEAASGSPQVLASGAPAGIDQFNDILAKGAQYAADLAEAEAAKLRPIFAKFFAAGNYTSGFGQRWGVQHTGVDIAAPIGTPLYAVADGTVIEAGPASGFGMWVRLLHDDGTVTIYGHIDTATVSQGQRVMAGDQIATIGNRGFSTGPHCHFEVWLNGSDKIDPLPWLASRGISLGVQRD
ncbi:peptidoglycan DD-metalloendopeptidase family protein [Nocardia sp. NPDC055321]